jgi:hypothetical protein
MPFSVSLSLSLRRWQLHEEAEVEKPLQHADEQGASTNIIIAFVAALAALAALAAVAIADAGAAAVVSSLCVATATATLVDIFVAAVIIFTATFERTDWIRRLPRHRLGVSGTTNVVASSQHVPR